MTSDNTGKESYEELLKKIRELQELNDFKDKIIGIVSHDFRDTFNIISGRLDMLSEYFESLSENQKKNFLNELKESSLKISGMMDNLLSWMLVQVKGIKLQTSEENLSALIVSQFEILQLTSAGKNIPLRNNADPGIKVVADAEMIKTVLRNLLSNAIKYSEPGKEVYVNALKKGKEVEVCVGDDGIGISVERAETIFRTGQSTAGTKNETGVGIGLLICREFVEMNGGRIWAESQQGKGSRFYFTIPAAG